MSPLDSKALATVAILWERKDRWAVITYGDLAKRLGHAQHGMSGILDRVGAWCLDKGKSSLAMLVIGVDGHPHEGMFNNFAASTRPVSRENYEQRRVELWRESWDDLALPTPDDVAAAYQRHRPEGT